MSSHGRDLSPIGKAEPGRSVSDHGGGLICDCHGGPVRHVTMYGGKYVCDDCKENIVTNVAIAQERPDLIQVHAAWALARVQTIGDREGR